MKISLNWLRDYITTELSPEQIAETLTQIGLEVESMQQVEKIRGGLRGVVVGEVLNCIPHPAADRLHLTTVHIGTEHPISIVCGASNIAAGQKVPVATVGTTLYPISGETLTIKKNKIRGEVSDGMICASDELGLDTNHDGILVLPTDSIPGAPVSEVLGMKSDTVFEIGLTPNRTDAFSHIGVARDLTAAIKNMKGRGEFRDIQLTLPDISPISENNRPSAWQLSVNDSDACPRYAGILLDNITVMPSPEWLRDRLHAIGIRSVNNVVDITNYVQHEWGQPLHAFDAAKMTGNQVIVRKATAGEKLITLDGIERKLSPEDLVICNAEKPVCIAGILGGIDSGVSETTKTIFIESAYFQSSAIRKTARRHGLNTDASFRFERGTDPNQVIPALQRAIGLIQQLCNATIASPVYEYYPKPLLPAQVNLQWKSITRLIGAEIPHKKIREILNDLDFTIQQEIDDGLLLQVPMYRTDVLREADVIEEILRIYGYDNIDFPDQIKSSMGSLPQPNAEKIQQQMADFLVAKGFSEIMGMSLTKSKYTEKFPSEDISKEREITLLNPLSSDLSVLRQSLIFSGLEAIALNQNRRHTDLRLFEFGKIYQVTDQKKYRETSYLSLFLTGLRFPENWNNTKEAVSFVDLDAVVGDLFNIGGIFNVSRSPLQHPHFSNGLTYFIHKNKVADLGNVEDALLAYFDIKQPVWCALIAFESFIYALPKNGLQYHTIPKFPSVRRDLSLCLDDEIPFDQIKKIAFEAAKKWVKKINLFDVYKGKNLDEGKKSYAISFILQDTEKTMTDQQVEHIMEKIQKDLSEKLGAVLRQ